MTEIKTPSIAELAEDAFLKRERFQCLSQMNTPTDFEERKKSFIQYELARAAMIEADRCLELAQRRT